jgi:hypothetical protein
MQQDSTYPNRKNRRMLMRLNNLFKNRSPETANEFRFRIIENIKNGKQLHNNHVDKLLKNQEVFLMDREEKYRAALKLEGKKKKEIDKAVEKWYTTIFKVKK